MFPDMTLSGDPQHPWLYRSSVLAQKKEVSRTKNFGVNAEKLDDDLHQAYPHSSSHG
jgi:hypothetical protein